MNKYVTNLTLPNGTNVLIKDSECRTNLSNEVTRATKKETWLQQNINTIEQAREDGDNRLQQAINNETNRATTKETELQNLIETIKNALHPIGSIYMSMNSTSPASIFGGTWEQIKDKFLLSSGSTYSAGSTGGEATHKLTIDEMPSHNHIERANNSYSNTYNLDYLVYPSDSGHTAGFMFDFNNFMKWANDVRDKTGVQTNKGIGEWISKGEVITNESSGGSNAHNNMPPYITVYMWKRIS